MNSLSTVAQGVEENPIETLGRSQSRMASVIHVLSVGPMDSGSMVHDALLDEPNFHLTIATDCRKLWMIPKQESLHVVILHNTFSWFELEDASRFVRRQWPRAKILVISEEEHFPEDALYDDRIAPAAAAKFLFTTIEQLTGGLHA